MAALTFWIIVIAVVDAITPKNICVTSLENYWPRSFDGWEELRRKKRCFVSVWHC